MQSAGLPTSLEGLDALQVLENSTYPVTPEFDDEPITNTTEVIPTHLRTCPYSFILNLPTFSSAAYGLLLLASRQVRWTSSMPNTLIPQTIAQPIRNALLRQMPIIIRGNTEAPKLSRDICCLTSLAFTGRRPTDCYKHFTASVLYTTHKHITATEYRYRHERATSTAELSPPPPPSPTTGSRRHTTGHQMDGGRETKPGGLCAYGCGLQPHPTPIHAMCPLSHTPGEPVHDHQVPHPTTPSPL